MLGVATGMELLLESDLSRATFFVFVSHGLLRSGAATVAFVLDVATGMRLPLSDCLLHGRIGAATVGVGDGEDITRSPGELSRGGETRTRLVLSFRFPRT